MVKREAGPGLKSEPVQKKTCLREESIYMYLRFFYSFHSLPSLSKNKQNKEEERERSSLLSLISSFAGEEARGRSEHF